jgi:hypothetical protein
MNLSIQEKLIFGKEYFGKEYFGLVSHLNSKSSAGFLQPIEADLRFGK